MRSLLQSALIALLTAFSVAAQVSHDAQTDAEKDILRFIRERLEAAGRADAIAWARFVADDCLCGMSTKAAIQHEIATRPPSLKNWYGDITAFEVRVYADTAVTRYRVTEYTGLGDQRHSAQQWRIETYLHRDGMWLLVGGIDSVIPPDPAVAKINPKIYDDYVGRYEYAPGVVDAVTREGDRLMVQVSGQAKEELFAENETTYFGKGQGWRLIFVKDKQGRVTSVRFRQHGQDFIAKKIP
jgi:hypothetical protein